MKQGSTDHYDRLQVKLTSMVLKVVLVVFLLIFGIVLITSYRYYRSQEINSQQIQLNKTASQVLTLQTTTENLVKQVLYDETVQRAFGDVGTSVGIYLYDRRNAQKTLLKYSHSLEGIQELLLYKSDGQTVSSQEVRDPFNPERERNDWYQRFLETGKQEEYSGVHSSEPYSGGNVEQVISYILRYFPSEMNGYQQGDIIANIRFSKLQNMVQFEDTMISGYCLFGSDHTSLLQEKNLTLDYDEILDEITGQGSTGVIPLKSGNVLLYSRELEDDWMLAVEIDGRSLLHAALRSNAYLLVIFLILAVVLIIALHLAINRFVTPIKQLSDAAAAVGEGDFTVSVDINTRDELEMLADVFNKMVVNIRTLMHESVEHEKVRRKMQVENLLLQINPHFIYNTMNSIVYMARMNGNPQIADFANAFISLLQGTLREDDSVYNTVRGELETARNYLYLQQYRYPDKFTYEIDCPEELLDCQILNVMLQPAVENAIFHGLAPKETSGVLKISVQRIQGETHVSDILNGKDDREETADSNEKDVLCIRIEDDGVGMSAETLMQQNSPGQAKHRGIHGIGVANVRERIVQIYGEDYGLEIESEEGVGTCVIMKVPYEKAVQE